LDGQSAVAKRTIQERDQELAALRHAIHDAALVGTRIGSERLQVELQTVDGWKRLMTALLNTPLSAPQRGLVAETLCALDGWRNGRAAAANNLEFEVIPPDLQRSDFNCAEVFENALTAVRKHADETGAKIQTTLVRPLPDSAHGNPQDIHQLITMLASSLPVFAHADNLELQISSDAQRNGSPAMLLSFLLSSPESAGSLSLRLRTLTESSAKPRFEQSGATEVTIRSAWQLALALGGSPTIETTLDGKLHVQISLPLPAVSSTESDIE
jgi:hypothetical protein